MTYECAAPHCDNELKRNMPGIDTGEVPYWTLTEESDIGGGATSKYFCSHGCVQVYLEHVVQI